MNHQKVFLIGPDGIGMPFGSYAGKTEREAINTCAQKCKGTLKRLTVGEYMLRCGSTSISIKEFKL